MAIDDEHPWQDHTKHNISDFDPPPTIDETYEIDQNKTFPDLKYHT
jgi:hypothetical protein